MVRSSKLIRRDVSVPADVRRYRNDRVADRLFLFEADSVVIMSTVKIYVRHFER